MNAETLASSPFFKNEEKSRYELNIDGHIALLKALTLSLWAFISSLRASISLFHSATSALNIAILRLKATVFSL